MRQLADFLPLVVFFAAYQIGGLMVATAALMVAAVAQILAYRLLQWKIEPMLLAAVGLAVVFGGLTIALDNALFIKWKPTVLYWGFALALSAAQIFWGKNPVKAILGRAMELPDSVWVKVNAAWAGFFAAMGAINLIVLYSFDESVWVKTRSFGYPLLTLAFAISQFAAVHRRAIYKATR